MRRSSGRRYAAQTRGMIVAALALLALAVAGCGGAGAAGGASTGARSSLPTVRPTASKMVSCVSAPVAGGSAPSAILRSGDANHDATVPVGAVVEIRMDAHLVWHLSSVTPSGALTPVGPQGALEGSDCVWDFQVAQAGASVVTFTGTALCQPTQMCPQYALLAKFTIHGA